MEIKDCPFCGGKASKGCGIESIHCSNIECVMPGISVSIEQWNTRPIEDALRAKREAAEAYIEAIEEFDAISCQPECFLFKSDYDESVNKCVEKCTSAREAWEKAKGKAATE